ncbi:MULTISPECIES: histidine kinase [Nonomuraea]|uniref:sensor histidine kinase n=1 Tax=Nonomuraea TaxID=83681 RepID=UPI001C5E14F5|nr:histidine kinase [Nonomuraea ceibae]
MTFRTRYGIVALAVLASVVYVAGTGWLDDPHAAPLWDLAGVAGPLWAAWVYIVMGLIVWSQRHVSSLGRRTVAIGFTWFTAGLRSFDHPVLAGIGDLAPGVLFVVFAYAVFASSPGFPFTAAGLLISLLGWLAGGVTAMELFLPVPGLGLLLAALVTWPIEVMVRVICAGNTRVRGLLAENEHLHGEVKDARGKVVEAMDAGRRSIERDLHDGAQQRLVNVGMSLTLARTRLAEPPEAGAALNRAMMELEAALEELRELARGVYPAILADAGLGPALESLAERAALPVVLEDLPARRLPSRVEETAYFLTSEAIANAAKHAGASQVVVRLRDEGSRLILIVSDDGAGNADPSGSGLRGLADRAAAVGGHVRVHSPAGAGTRVTASLPVPDPATQGYPSVHHPARERA